MKRYRCPDCAAVHTLRPAQYWRGLWAPWTTILVSLLSKVKKKRWLGGRLSHQRQHYWWAGFQIQLNRQGLAERTREELHRLLSHWIIVATHSLKYCAIARDGPPAHRIFAWSPPLDSQ